MNRCEKNENNKGFTLIELLVGIVLAGIISVWIGMAISSLGSTKSNLENKANALNECNNILDTIQNGVMNSYDLYNKNLAPYNIGKYKYDLALKTKSNEDKYMVLWLGQNENNKNTLYCVKDKYVLELNSIYENENKFNKYILSKDVEKFTYTYTTGTHYTINITIGISYEGKYYESSRSIRLMNTL